ncbi:MAG: Mce protein, partial [Mycobacterium sp.]
MSDADAAESEDSPLDDNESAVESPAPAELPSEPSATRKWLVRNKTRVVIAASAGLFIGAGAFAGAAVQPYLADRAAVATKENIARTAADAITTLW